MYQNCFTAGPFTEMKSTLCQVHRWPRPRAHGSPEAPRAPFHPYDGSPGRRQGREREKGGALSISVCNQPFHQFGDIARRITFGMALPTMTAVKRLDYYTGTRRAVCAIVAEGNHHVMPKFAASVSELLERVGIRWLRLDYCVATLSHAVSHKDRLSHVVTGNASAQPGCARRCHGATRSNFCVRILRPEIAQGAIVVRHTKARAPDGKASFKRSISGAALRRCEGARKFVRALGDEWLYKLVAPYQPFKSG
ncbi:hypothetical protein DBV15_08745, partial [Temnothorax longispinosus]